MDRMMTFSEKRDWLRRRGYVHNPVNDCFSITIAVEVDTGTAYVQETLTWDEIKSMNKDQLAGHDARAWMKARQEITEWISSSM